MLLVSAALVDSRLVGLMATKLRTMWLEEDAQEVEGGPLKQQNVDRWLHGCLHGCLQ